MNKNFLCILLFVGIFCSCHAMDKPITEKTPSIPPAIPRIPELVPTIPKPIPTPKLPPAIPRIPELVPRIPEPIPTPTGPPETTNPLERYLYVANIINTGNRDLPLRDAMTLYLSTALEKRVAPIIVNSTVLKRQMEISSPSVFLPAPEEDFEIFESANHNAELWLIIPTAYKTKKINEWLDGKFFLQIKDKYVRKAKNDKGLLDLKHGLSIVKILLSIQSTTESKIVWLKQQAEFFNKKIAQIIDGYKQNVRDEWHAGKDDFKRTYEITLTDQAHAIGIAIDNENILKKRTIAQAETLLTRRINDATSQKIAKELTKIFIPNKHAANGGSWLIWQTGHGYLSTPKREGLITNLSVSDYRDILLEFFDKKLKVSLLAIETCFAGGAHFLLPYMEASKQRPAKYHFPIIHKGSSENIIFFDKEFINFFVLAEQRERSASVSLENLLKHMSSKDLRKTLANMYSIRTTTGHFILINTNKNFIEIITNVRVKGAVATKKDITIEPPPTSLVSKYVLLSPTVIPATILVKPFTKLQFMSIRPGSIVHFFRKLDISQIERSGTIPNILRDLFFLAAKEAKQESQKVFVIKKVKCKILPPLGPFLIPFETPKPEIPFLRDKSIGDEVTLENVIISVEGKNFWEERTGGKWVWKGSATISFQFASPDEPDKFFTYQKTYMSTSGWGEAIVSDTPLSREELPTTHFSKLTKDPWEKAAEGTISVGQLEGYKYQIDPTSKLITYKELPFPLLPNQEDHRWLITLPLLHPEIWPSEINHFDFIWLSLKIYDDELLERIKQAITTIDPDRDVAEMDGDDLLQEIYDIIKLRILTLTSSERAAFFQKAVQIRAKKIIDLFLKTIERIEKTRKGLPEGPMATKIKQSVKELYALRIPDFDRSGRTVSFLQACIIIGWDDIALRLINIVDAEEINYVSPERETLLFSAIRHNKPVIARHILKRIDVANLDIFPTYPISDLDHPSPLWFAALYNMPHVVEQLIAKGVRIEEALVENLIQRVDIKMVKLILAELERRENPEALEKHPVARSEQIERLFVQKISGLPELLANIMEQAVFYHRNEDLIIQLAPHAKNIEIEDPDVPFLGYGKLSLLSACMKYNLYRAARALIDAGANIKADRYRPVKLAIRAKRPDILLPMMETNLDFPFAIKDDNLDELIIVATRENWEEIARTLIGARVPLDRKEGRTGRSLLHLAAINGNLNLVQIFAEERLDVNERDLEGKTPLDYAIANNHDDVRDYLSRHGAIESS